MVLLWPLSRVLSTISTTLHILLLPRKKRNYKKPSECLDSIIFIITFGKDRIRAENIMTAIRSWPETTKTSYFHSPKTEWSIETDVNIIIFIIHRRNLNYATYHDALNLIFGQCVDVFFSFLWLLSNLQSKIDALSETEICED